MSRIITPLIKQAKTISNKIKSKVSIPAKGSKLLNTDTFVSKSKASEVLTEKILKFDSAFFSAYVSLCVASATLKSKLPKTFKDIGNIKFIPAKGLDEAIEFGQKKLNIQEYQGFDINDLDVINYVNEGLTNLSNAFNGKLTLPARVKLHLDETPNLIASVNPFYFHTRSNPPHLNLNRAYFESLDSSILDEIENFKRANILEENNDLVYFVDSIIAPDFIESINLFKANPSNFSLQEKLELRNNLDSLISVYNSFTLDPLFFIEKFLKEQLALRTDSVEYELHRFLSETKLNEESKKVQYAFLKQGLHDGRFSLELEKNDAFTSIYHEIAHLNDKKYRTSPATKYDNPNEYPLDLRKWLENEDFISSASRVTSYAKSGPGEFVADVFAGKMQGRNFYGDENVEFVYKLLEGPDLPKIN